jgi:2-alkyl-3-oxoalkanoate reductase
MKVLITGASGFLGTQVVRELSARGHEVRALVRPHADVTSRHWADTVEVVRGDLRDTSRQTIGDMLAGIDVLVHLAAVVHGAEDERFRGTVLSTERLLEALVDVPVRRVVLASSYSVYDWGKARRTLVETTPLATNLDERDAYTAAKVWQERLIRAAQAAQGWELCVLRPGFISDGTDWIFGAGVRARALTLLVGPRRHLPITTLRNCADCFATAVESPRAAGQTYNVVDGPGPRAWSYARWHHRRFNTKAVLVPVPYVPALLTVKLVAATVRRLSRWPQPRLPSLFVPARFVARFKPLRHSNGKLQRQLGWLPPHPSLMSANCSAGTGRPLGQACVGVGGLGEQSAG